MTGSVRMAAPHNPPRPGAAPTQAWSDLHRRTASALVLLPLVMAAWWLGGPAWWLLIAAATLVLLAEWRGMCRQGRLPTAWRLAGHLYGAVALASLIWLRAAPATGRATVLFLLLVVWASDIGAYLAGRAIGGRRLAPLISPGKTWSGAAGGALAAMLVGTLLTLPWPAPARLPACLLALAIGIAAQAGDLLESGLKRRCGVKDSGRLLPGHGGLLDRVDGMLLAAPVLVLLAPWLGRGIAQDIARWI